MAGARSGRRNEDTSAESDYVIVQGMTDPRRNKSRIEEVNGGLLEDSYSWILKSVEFLRWRDERKNRLLWIRGEPGSGKTMHICGIINELENFNNGVGFLSFFFCQGTDSRNSDAVAVLRGLIDLLIQRRPLLVKYTRRGRKRKAVRPVDETSAWETLSGIFYDILRDPVVQIRGACFIIDALDECTTGLPGLLNLISRTLLDFPRVKWIVSSGDGSPVVEQCLQSSTQTAELCLQSSLDAVSAAICTYIKHRVRRLAELRAYDVETETEVRNGLENARSTFLWVALACRSLAAIQQCDVLPQLRALPHGLDPLYAHMARIIECRDQRGIYKRVLTLAAVARRPLTLPELSLFLEMPEDTVDDRISLADIVRHCDAFLTLRDDTIYFAHSSAKAFLLANIDASDDAGASRIREANETIFTKSIEAMSKTLQRDMYSLRHLGCTIDQVRQPSLDSLAEVKYSCVYWIDHLYDSYQHECASSNGDELADGGPVYTFLCEKYLYWLEALSLLRCIPAGVRAMEILENLLERQGSSPQLLDLARDAHRFIVAHRLVLEHAPLQTYASALLFTPASNRVRQMNKGEEPSWLLAKPHISTLHSGHSKPQQGHHNDRVWSLVFSPSDSQRAASASDDGTIKIWDTTTGTCVRTLRGHRDSIRSISFSQDGKRIASTSDDGTVNVWDAARGRCIQTLDSCHDVIFSPRLTLRKASIRLNFALSFSHNGEQVAFPSASREHNLEIRDPTTCETVRTLRGHSTSILTVAFWRNSQLASGSHDDTIRIWDAKSGECLHTLDEQNIYRLSYSHDGKQLASAAYSAVGGIKTWDVSTGKCIQEFKPKEGANCAVFSHDDALLAGGLENSTIQVWNSQTGESIMKFEGHGDEVTHLQFSKDGLLLVSGGLNGELKVWNARTGECLQEFHHGSAAIRGLAIARSGQYFLSVSAGGTVMASSISSGACLAKFQGIGRNLSISGMSYSHDGQQLVVSSDAGDIRFWDILPGGTALSASLSSTGQLLATGSEGGNIRFWDVATGKFLAEPKGLASPVYCIAFSDCDQYVAAGSEDGSVSMWTVNGISLWATSSHTGSVWAVCFSPDSNRIASASNDRTLQVWDLSTFTCLQRIDVGTSLSSLSFDSTCSYLYTEIGPFKLTAEDAQRNLPASSSKVTNTAKPAAELASDSASTASGKDLASDQQLDSEQHHYYGLSLDRRWITDNGENVLLLPPEYRPLSSAVSEHAIGIGCRSGQVIFFGF